LFTVHTPYSIMDCISITISITISISLAVAL